MTEPSKEAAEALAQVMYAEPANDPERKIAIAGLEAALPIERNRWEQEVRERLLSELEKKRQWAVHGTNTPGDKLTEGEMVKGVPVVEVAGVNEAIDAAFDGTPEEAMSERIAATELKRAEGLKAIFGEAEPVEGENGG